MILEYRNISKTYDRKKKALSEFNAVMNEGVYALLGPNGSGKSTLMSITAGVLKPTTGQVILDGRDTVSMKADFRKILAYLPQNPGFYESFTGAEILGYFAELKGLKAPEKRINEMLEFVNLFDERKQRYGTYSGGMKRRLGIAVALLNDPKLLILDEPTAGLDPKERVRFRNIISDIGRDRIIIYATHIVSDVEEIADSVILLKDGKAILNGSVPELTGTIKGNVWEAYFDRNVADEYASNHTNTMIVREGERTKLRVVSKDKPFDDAVPSEAFLEDVYMYYFGDNSEDKAIQT